MKIWFISSYLININLQYDHGEYFPIIENSFINHSFSIRTVLNSGVMFNNFILEIQR